RFLDQARRVAPELVVVESLRHPGDPAAAWVERRLSDGSTWSVYKRVFDGPDLADELGGRVVFSGPSVLLLTAFLRLAPPTGRSPRCSGTSPSAARASKPAIRSGRCRSGASTSASARTSSGRLQGPSRAKNVARGAGAPGRRSGAGSSSTKRSSTRRFTAPR